MSFVFLTALVFATLRLATPLIFTSLGGMMSERSGVVNIALEGFMLVGAFTAAIVSHATGSAWLGWVAASLSGLAIALFYAVMVIRVKADQIVTGTAINLLVAGAIPFLSKILFNSTGSTPALDITSRFHFEPVLMAIVLVFIIHWWLHQTSSGLWLSFAGEHPHALESSGIHVNRVRYFGVIMSGVFAAWGGASLSIYLASSYSPMMSGGRGFMALAALIFGKWKPIPSFLACLFFGLTDALQIQLQGVSIGGFQVPVQFIQILPYIVTIIAVSGFVGKSQAPKALGEVYEH